MTPMVWTTRRRLLGNLVPGLFWAPLALGGIALIVLQGRVFGAGLVLLAAATIAGWLALNRFGLIENARMRRSLERILAARGEAPEEEACFVGFASPSYAGVLDAHEDVGFLSLGAERLTFLSETRRVEVARSDVTCVRFRRNAHSLLGLGRWIAIEGERAGRPIRMLIEPREKATMRANVAFGRALRQRIDQWRGIG